MFLATPTFPLQNIGIARCSSFPEHRYLYKSKNYLIDDPRSLLAQLCLRYSAEIINDVQMSLYIMFAARKMPIFWRSNLTINKLLGLPSYIYSIWDSLSCCMRSVSLLSWQILVLSLEQKYALNIATASDEFHSVGQTKLFFRAIPDSINENDGTTQDYSLC